MSIVADAAYPYDPRDIDSMEGFRNDGNFLNTDWVEEAIGTLAMNIGARYKKGEEIPFACYPSREAFLALTYAEQAMQKTRQRGSYLRRSPLLRSQKLARLA